MSRQLGYGVLNNSESRNLDYRRHAGYSSSRPGLENYFSDNTIKTISFKVSQLLQGLDPQGRTIVVSDENIINVMNSIFENYRPQTGSIYSRYIIPTSNDESNMYQDMIDQVIQVIYADVVSNLGMIQNNEKLTAWTTVLGDFNEHGLRAHPKIKLREKKPNPMEFHMRY